MVDELDRTHGRRTKQSHFFYKGHSWSSVIGQTLAFDSARKRLWNTCYQLYLHRGKGQHNDKLITHFDQTTELGAPHVFTGSSLRWSVSSPFPLLISNHQLLASLTVMYRFYLLKKSLSPIKMGFITSITFMPRSHQWYVLVFVSKVFVVAHRVHTFLRLTIVFLLWWCVHDNFQQYGT